MDTAAVGLALAELIGQVRSDMTVYGFNPAAVVPPCVFPDSWERDFTGDQVMLGGGGAPTTFTLLVLVSRADDKSWQGVRDEIADDAPGAVYQDSTLGGLVSDVFVTAIRSAATREYAAVDYIALEVDVQVLG